MFMLQELDLVDTDEFQTILSMFNAVDANDDGVLDVADICRRLQSGDVRAVETDAPQQDE